MDLYFLLASALLKKSISFTRSHPFTFFFFPPSGSHSLLPQCPLFISFLASFLSSCTPRCWCTASQQSQLSTLTTPVPLSDTVPRLPLSNSVVT